MGRRKWTEAELEQQLAEGKWLSPGEAARIAGVGRATVQRWIIAGETPKGFRLRHRETGSGHRLCDPEDLAVIVAKWKQDRDGVSQ